MRYAGDKIALFFSSCFSSWILVIVIFHCMYEGGDGNTRGVHYGTSLMQFIS